MKSFHKRFQKDKVYNQIYDGNIKENGSVHNKDTKHQRKDFIFYKK